MRQRIDFEYILDEAMRVVDSPSKKTALYAIINIMLNLVLMMNNYFHDVAAALLVTSGAVVIILARQAENTNSKEVISYFISSYKKLTFLGRLSLLWIGLGGAIRLINFKSFEWVNAVGKNQVPALIIKHIIIFAFVGLGIYFWRQLNKKVSTLEKKVAGSTESPGKQRLVKESL